jgi:peptidoglycan/LPS O-acetylase OafA/YrhL
MPVSGPTATLAGAAVPAYRPDIDGLRALAVLAVILFHSGVPGVGGGYAGVDVFFVISGYLITRLLEQSRGQSTRRALADFYLRRARRILPALLVTCAVSAVVAAVLFLPRELVDLGRYLAATPLLLSNVASWAGGGYFAPRRPTVPLQHLWSIAVEEQFYLIYPLVLLLLTRYLPRQRALTLMAVALASLALCMWASRAHPVANYYLAPARAWELLLGAMLALATPHVEALPARPLAFELLGVAGLLGIGLAVTLYGAQTPYPGAAALLPCAATAALIVSGARARPALVNRVLAWRPLVFVGLLSYSLYLWHRPLLVFAGYYHIEPLGPAAVGLMLTALVLVAFISWRFIEQPIRTRRLLRTPAALIAAAAFASVLIFAVGVVLWRSNGFPQRFSPEARLLLADVPGGADWVRCISTPIEQVRAGRLCNDLAAPGASKVLVWGDSHALALMPGLQALEPTYPMHLYLAAKSSCEPLLPPPAGSPPHGDAAAWDWCARFNAAVMEAIAGLDPDTIILAARWVDSGIPAGVLDISSGIEQTVRRIGAGRAVCIVLGVPALRYPAPYALLMARRRKLAPDFLRISRSDALAQLGEVEPAVRALAARDALRLADPKDILCAADSCRFTSDGHSLYWDDNHLSPYGARFVAQSLRSCLPTGTR